MEADRGRNGQGTSKGGRRGEDILLYVPVGTVIREVSRYDPVAEDEASANAVDACHCHAAGEAEDPEELEAAEHRRNHRRVKWLLHPAAIRITSQPRTSLACRRLAKRPRHVRTARTHPSGSNKPMDVPMLLVAGASGAWGNTHFVTTSNQAKVRYQG